MHPVYYYFMATPAEWAAAGVTPAAGARTITLETHEGPTAFVVDHLELQSESLGALWRHRPGANLLTHEEMLSVLGAIEDPVV